MGILSSTHTGVNKKLQIVDFENKGFTVLSRDDMFLNTIIEYRKYTFNLGSFGYDSTEYFIAPFIYLIPQNDLQNTKVDTIQKLNIFLKYFNEVYDDEGKIKWYRTNGIVTYKDRQRIYQKLIDAAKEISEL